MEGLQAEKQELKFKGERLADENAAQRESIYKFKESKIDLEKRNQNSLNRQREMEQELQSKEVELRHIQYLVGSKQKAKQEQFLEIKSMISKCKGALN